MSTGYVVTSDFCIATFRHSCNGVICHCHVIRGGKQTFDVYGCVQPRRLLLAVRCCFVNLSRTHAHVYVHAVLGWHSCLHYRSSTLIDPRSCNFYRIDSEYGFYSLRKNDRAAGFYIAQRCRFRGFFSR